MPRLHRRDQSSRSNGNVAAQATLISGTEPGRRQGKPQLTEQEKEILDSVINQEAVYADLPLDQIQVDMSYQERPRETLVNQIATQFSEVMFGNLVISKRPDGSFWVVDGATRKFGLERGGHRARIVRCQIIRTSGPKQEALLFKHYNCNRKMVPIANRINAEGIAGVNPVRDIAIGCGFLLIGPKSNKRVLKGQSFLAEAYDLDGTGEALRKALFAMKTCWPGVRLNGGDVKAIAAVYHSQPRSCDDVVRKFLTNNGPEQLDGTAYEIWGGARKKVKARLHPGDRWRFAGKGVLFVINKNIRRSENRLDIRSFNNMFFRHAGDDDF
jgi:hypothetical protein